MPVIPMSHQPRPTYLYYSEITECIASTTSVIWIVDSRPPSSTVCKLNQRPYNWYLLLLR
jgi:hypothetical protein